MSNPNKDLDHKALDVSRYRRASQLTEAQKRRAETLADQMSEIIDDDLKTPVSEDRLAEFRRMRQELEDMGFLVETKHTVNPETLAVEVVVNLYVLKEPAGKS